MGEEREGRRAKLGRNQCGVLLGGRKVSSPHSSMLNVPFII